MIKNYLKIAWRNLVKNKAHSFINIFGLSVGLSVTILIGLWIYDEISYNKSFANYDRIVQVMQHQTLNGNVLTQTSMPVPAAMYMRQNNKADFKYVVLSTWTDGHTLAYDDKKITQRGNYMQPEGPDLFSFNMLRGNRHGLQDPSSILISSSTAKAIFGNDDPINKVIKIDNAWDVKVAGVYQDLPYNTQFNDMQFVAPWDLYVTTMPWLKRATTRWGNNSWQIFAQLNPGADINRVSAKIRNLKAIHIAAQGDMVGASFKPAMFLQPMSKWHLYAEFKNGINTGGRIRFVWMFGIIGIFVLLLACINFMNLTTARSEKRAKEVGIRKTVGSLRSQLVGQFYAESMLFAVLAFLIALPLVELALPWFNQVADKKMTMPGDNPLFWLAGIGFSLITGLIAGSYPALYLSSFEPIKVLKGTFKAGKLAALPRQVLVVLQFTVSVALIIGTVVVFRQIQYTKDRPIGYDRNGLIQIELRTADIYRKFETFRHELLQTGVVTETAESGSPLTDVWSNSSGLNWPGKDPQSQDDFGIIPVTSQFGKTAGWQVKDGRDFSKEYASDSLAMVLNEAAVNFMKLKNPVGQVVDYGRKYTIIGVVKDMVMSSPYDPVKPSIFMLLDEPGGILSVRVNPKASMHDAIEKIGAVYKKFDPGSPFEYKFTDEQYAKKFENEERIGSLAGIFTALAIFISCMGLFGMASYMAEQRTKEIGIRKVLGATVMNLWQLLSKDFMLLIVISFAIAMPVAYYFMNNWLLDYKYRAGISWWIFALTGAGTLIITLLTVSYQSIKAALINPVKSLRSE